MNAKQFKYLTLFEEMSCADPYKESTAKKYLPAFINLDYALALDTWDYLCTTHEAKLASDPEKAAVFGSYALDLFYAKAAQKAVKALADLPAVRRAAYQYSPAATEGNSFAIIIDALLANKTDYAEDLFKCLVRNENIQYGAYMKKLLERLFIEILKKSSTKRIEMSRKLSALLLTYVSKIKTDERAMLEQRIRENM